MQPILGSMSEALEQHQAGAPVPTTNPQLRSLEFISDELRGMLESLHNLQSSELGMDYVAKDDFNKWLQQKSGGLLKVSSCSLGLACEQNYGVVTWGGCVVGLLHIIEIN